MEQEKLREGWELFRGGYVRLITGGGLKIEETNTPSPDCEKHCPDLHEHGICDLMQRGVCHDSEYWPYVREHAVYPKVVPVRTKIYCPKWDHPDAPRDKECDNCGFRQPKLRSKCPDQASYEEYGQLWTAIPEVKKNE